MLPDNSDPIAISFRQFRRSVCLFFFSSRRRHTRFDCDWSSDVCSSDLSSGITDGAAAVVLSSEDFIKKNSLKPLARILAVASAGVDPRIMGIGPVPALRKMEQKHNLKLAGFDLIELNEAFAAQVLACDRELHLDRDKLNVNGGAIALGHPIGCTGTRITVTLLHEMLKRKARRGVATLCVSGGMGMALALENVA